MSATPRTDALIEPVGLLSNFRYHQAVELARQLEIELAWARKDSKRLEWLMGLSYDEWDYMWCSVDHGSMGRENIDRAMERPK